MIWRSFYGYLNGCVIGNTTGDGESDDGVRVLPNIAMNNFIPPYPQAVIRSRANIHLSIRIGGAICISLFSIQTFLGLHRRRIIGGMVTYGKERT